jgi:hypothetical protein
MGNQVMLCSLSYCPGRSSIYKESSFTACEVCFFGEFISQTVDNTV